MHEGDLSAQFKLAWENLVEALSEAGIHHSSIVRLNLYQYSGQKIALNLASKLEPTLPKVFKSMSACKLTSIQMEDC
jgi:enamine deaminase RidA (YjgF/YER057c/UK114 family)